MNKGTVYQEPADPTVAGFISDSLDYAKNVNDIAGSQLFKDKYATAINVHRLQKIGVLKSNIDLLNYLIMERKTNISRARWAIKNLERQVFFSL